MEIIIAILVAVIILLFASTFFFMVLSKLAFDQSTELKSVIHRMRAEKQEKPNG